MKSTIILTIIYIYKESKLLHSTTCFTMFSTFYIFILAPIYIYNNI